MSSADFGARLAAERSTVQAQVTDLTESLRSIIEASEEGSHDDEHDPDGSTIAFERAQTAALLVAAELRLLQIDQAEQRVRSDSFGRCETCREPIAPERLLALPLTTTCTNCAVTRQHPHVRRT